MGCRATARGDPASEADLPRYRHLGSATVTLITVLSKRDGSGGHSALIVNGEHRVIFDPEGSLSHTSLAVSSDVIYGANPAVVESFIGYHTRKTDDTVTETLDIADAVASDLLTRVMLHRTVMQSYGTQSVGALSRSTPGFEGIRPMFPSKNLMESFAAQPGVRPARFSQ